MPFQDCTIVGKCTKLKLGLKVKKQIALAPKHGRAWIYQVFLRQLSDVATL